MGSWFYYITKSLCLSTGQLSLKTTGALDIDVVTRFEIRRRNESETYATHVSLLIVFHTHRPLHLSYSVRALRSFQLNGPQIDLTLVVQVSLGPTLLRQTSCIGHLRASLPS
jgi:hypothetical protein